MLWLSGDSPVTIQFSSGSLWWLSRAHPQANPPTRTVQYGVQSSTWHVAANSTTPRGRNEHITKRHQRFPPFGGLPFGPRNYASHLPLVSVIFSFLRSAHGRWGLVCLWRTARQQSLLGLPVLIRSRRCRSWLVCFCHLTGHQRERSRNGSQRLLQWLGYSVEGSTNNAQHMSQ